MVEDQTEARDFGDYVPGRLPAAPDSPPQNSSGTRVMGFSPPPCKPGKLIRRTLAWVVAEQQPPSRENFVGNEVFTGC